MTGCDIFGQERGWHSLPPRGPHLDKGCRAGWARHPRLNTCSSGVFCGSGEVDCEEIAVCGSLSLKPMVQFEEDVRAASTRRGARRPCVDSLTASFVPGLFRRPELAGAVPGGAAPLSGWLGMVSGDSAGPPGAVGELDPGRRPAQALCALPSESTRPRTWQGQHKEEPTAPWQRAAPSLPVTLGFPQALMAACLEQKNQRGLHVCPREMPPSALQRVRPSQQEALGHPASPEGRPEASCGMFCSPVCVQHAAAVTGRQAGRREASSVLGRRASGFHGTSVPSCLVRRAGARAAGPDV